MKKIIRLISIFLALSILLISGYTASATEGYFDISDDGFYMDIYNNPEDIDVPSSIQDLFINDAELDQPLNLDNGNIQHVTFKNCTLNMSDIGEFENLDAVTIVNCKLKDLTILSSNPDITFVDIDSCYIESLNGIQKLKNLEVLCLYDVGIQTLAPIKNNDNLEEITLYSTCVNDLSPIENMDIKSINISNSLSICDISPIMTLKKLDYFSGNNCEMLYTTDFCEFIKKNHISNDIPDNWQKIQKSVNKIADKIFKPNMTDRKIIEATVKYVTDIMEYDVRVDNDEDLSNEYNDKALKYALKGKGLCRNYTALTTVLLKIAGIEVYEIKSENHIQNIVKSGNKFYWIDTTWLDGLTKEEIINSPYFMNEEFDFPDHDTFTVPSAMLNPHYEIASDFMIRNPSTKTINYKDGIILHTTLEDDKPDGVKVIWSSTNNNFEITNNEDSSITVISKIDGSATFTAEFQDENGDVIATDTIEMQSKAGFFNKIGSFFRSLFGATKIYEK